MNFESRTETELPHSHYAAVETGSLPTDERSIPKSVADSDSELSSVAVKYGRHNFVVIALYQIVLRIGWIFKTESIVMPAVLDSIGGGPWLRGFLPPLNRFGQSIPPLLAARRIKNMSRKKHLLAMTTGLCGVLFLLLSVLWLVGGPGLTTATAAVGHTPAEHTPAAGWLKYVFLVVYAVFFVVVGINQLAFSTLNGKLVAVQRRGRLLLVANIIGSIIAVTCAWFLLRLWLTEDGGNFVLIFGFTGTLFVISALVCLQLREGRDRYSDRRQPVTHLFGDAWQTLHRDRDFARLALVGATFGSSMVLFPHYQAIGREQLGLDFTELLVWVVVQNIGTGVFSLPAGLIADRFGNRIVLKLVMLGLLCGPVITLVLADGWLQHWLPVSAAFSERLYPAVFVLIGLTPIGFKIFANYALELTTSEHHPRYLSTLSLCIAAPVMLLSPLAGVLVGWVGYQAVFVITICVLLFGWSVIFTIREPRTGSR